MNLQNKYCLFIMLSLVFISCIGQSNKEENISKSKSINKTINEPKIPLPENGFYCGNIDREGNLWFGSRGNGVFKFDGKSFTNYTTMHGLCDNDISCISVDKKGNLWFGTTSGACYFNGEKFESLKIPESEISSIWLDKVYPVVNPNQVMSILEDKEGNLWLGTNGAGVYKFSDNKFTQYLSAIGMVYEDELYHNIILSIIEDLKGNIWFTSLSHGGVSVYNGDKFTHYTSELSDDFIRVVFCDTKGNIWVGTHGNHKGGLDKFDGNQFTAFYKTDDGLSHNNVMDIYEDKTGLLWIASGTTELSTFDGKNFKIFKDKQENTYDKITFILGDDQGNIWFGNRDGLWKYDGKEMNKMTKA